MFWGFIDICKMIAFYTLSKSKCSQKMYANFCKKNLTLSHIF